MRRPGLLSIKAAVLALLGVLTVFAVITGFTDLFNVWSSTQEDQLDASERQQIKISCLRQKLQICEDGNQNWAAQATYDGKTCKQWHQQEQIFGANSGIPSC